MCSIIVSIIVIHVTYQQVGVICHMPICHYVIVIELDEIHVIVFLSIYDNDMT
jgi:hypothetical protein